MPAGECADGPPSGGLRRAGKGHWKLGKYRKLVLVVDDDRAVRESLKFSLELEGLVVETYASGALLLEKGDPGAAGCLVLDCRMPELDGFGVIAELAARHITVPVVLITAPVTDSVRRRAREAGAFGLLEKPLLGDELLETVRRATMTRP